MAEVEAQKPVAEGEQLEQAPKFDALAPVGDQRNLKAMLEKMSGSMKALLPSHVTPDRLIKTMLVAANRNPDLLLCTQASIVETIQRAAELGLDLSGTLGEAYPVPFNNKIRFTAPNGQKQEMWVKQCQLIPGYRGLAKLARQSGEIKRIESEVVYQKDEFDYVKGTAFRLVYRPHLQDDRGPALGAYSLAEFKDGGLQADFMTVGEIERIRKISKSGADKKTGAPIGPWRDHWPEMAKKTVFRRLAKWLPLSSDKFAQAIEADNVDVDLEDLMPTVEVVTNRVDDLIEKLEAKGAEPEAGSEVEGAADEPEEDADPTAEEAAAKEPAATEAKAATEAPKKKRPGAPPWDTIDDDQTAELLHMLRKAGASEADLLAALETADIGAVKWLPVEDYDNAKRAIAGLAKGGGKKRNPADDAQQTLT
jgi:recombination protein RecT